MNKILFVNSCIRPESRTRMLAERVLSRLDGEIEEVNLEREKIMPMGAEQLAQRDRAIREGNQNVPMLRYAKQFLSADIIVIAAPYWDLSFPAALRSYLEAVTICGITFYYTEDGRPVPLCQARKLIYVTTAGGPLLQPDHGFEYLRSLAEYFYGIPEILCFSAENLDIAGADVPGILKKAIREIDGSPLL